MTSEQSGETWESAHNSFAMLFNECNRVANALNLEGAFEWTEGLQPIIDQIATERERADKAETERYKWENDYLGLSFVLAGVNAELATERAAAEAWLKNAIGGGYLRHADHCRVVPYCTCGYDELRAAYRATHQPATEVQG